MRMHGLGRLAYDASDGSGSQTATSLMLALIRADWSKFKKEDHARYLSPILDQTSAQSLHIEEGSIGTQATSGSLQPKVCPASLSIPSRRRRVLLVTSRPAIKHHKTLMSTLSSCTAKQAHKAPSHMRSTPGSRTKTSKNTRKIFRLVPRATMNFLSVRRQSCSTVCHTSCAWA